MWVTVKQYFSENKILQLQPFVTYGKCLYYKSYLDTALSYLGNIDDVTSNKSTFWAKINLKVQNEITLNLKGQKCTLGKNLKDQFWELLVVNW